MARQKIKNVKLEQNELKPIVIGIFENRKKSSIGIFIILSLFILFVIFLPNISKYIDNYLHPKIEPTIPIKKPTNPVTPNTPDKENNNLVTFNESTVLKNDEITVDRFSISNNKINFRVTNNAMNYLELTDYNYFLELYDNSSTLLERIKVLDFTGLGPSVSTTYTKNIKNANIGLIALAKKTPQDYINYTIKSKDDGSGSLVCTNNYERVIYKFQNNNLKEVSNELSHKVSDANYLTEYEQNKILSNTYNGKIGVTSTNFEYSEGYNITTNVNLNEASRLYIFSADSFNKDETPKVVKFEMEAQGFTCS